MLKSLAIFAVFFAVTQAIVPVSGQTPDHDTGKSDQAQQDAASSPAKPAHPATIPKPPEADHPKGEGNGPHETNNKNSVTITESAAVANKRDWFDYLTLFIGIVLAGITGAGVVAAWQGLPQLFRQAESAKIAADAARDSADAALISSKAMIAADRPWLLIRRATSAEEEYMNGLTFNAYNVGKSPAEVLFFDFETSPSPPSETLPWLDVALEHDSWVAPGGKHKIGHDFPGTAPNDDIWYMGIIKYRGPLRDEVYESQFCFFYNRKFDAHLIMAGPKGYNHYT